MLLHDVAPCAMFETVPGGHAAQLLPPLAEYLPFGHELQVGAPALALKVPGPHEAQLERPPYVANLPAGQEEQLVAPLA